MFVYILCITANGGEVCVSKSGGNPDYSNQKYCKIQCVQSSPGPLICIRPILPLFPKMEKLKLKENTTFIMNNVPLHYLSVSLHGIGKSCISLYCIKSVHNGVVSVIGSPSRVENSASPGSRLRSTLTAASKHHVKRDSSELAYADISPLRTS